jgi:dTMP kinase
LRGVFITFEGCEGSGKTTQLNAVFRALQASGLDILVTREPGGTPFGEMVREVLLDPSGPDRGILAETLLYSASRAELVRAVILPALQEGKVVLADRFADSTIVYQGYAGGISTTDIENINRIATGDLVADLTLVFDIDDPAVFRERLAPKDRDRIELRDDEYHARVRQGYRDLARRFPGRIKLVDGTLPRDQVERIVLAEVTAVVRQRKGGKAP